VKGRDEELAVPGVGAAEFIGDPSPLSGARATAPSTAPSMASEWVRTASCAPLLASPGMATFAARQLWPSRRAGRSLVAGVNALFRSREGRAAVPLIDDPYARLFGEGHPLIWALRALRFALPPLRRLIDELQMAHCVRHRSIDELCLRAAGDGFHQLVVLGAGYDSRPLRLAPRLPEVRWFEVDHPATAARKTRLARRARLDWNAARVAVDLERVELGPALASVGFDPTAPACFVLEGLAHYLDRPALARLLAGVAAGPGRRRIILSYIDRQMATRASSLFVALVGLLREVPGTTFDREELAGLAGLTLTGHWSFAQQVQRLLGTGASGPRLGQDVAILDA
jgi:methyltransferase (TIGR00027 family)